MLQFANCLNGGPFAVGTFGSVQAAERPEQLVHFVPSQVCRFRVPAAGIPRTWQAVMLKDLGSNLGSNTR